MSEPNGNRPLLEVRDLKEYFNIPMGMFRSRPLKAVDGVSFTINNSYLISNHNSVIIKVVLMTIFC